MVRSRFALAAFLFVFLGCAADATDPSTPGLAARDHHGGPVLGGTVYGPGSTGICSHFPASQYLFIMAYDSATGAPAGNAGVECPAGRYALNLPAAGSYWLVLYKYTPDLGLVAIPDVYLPRAAIPVGGYTARDLHVPEGEAPSGRALLDGVPVPDAAALLKLHAPGGEPVGTVYLTSGADGRWVNDYLGEPLTLQRNRAYSVECWGIHGATLTDATPAVATTFPADNRTVRCAYADGGRADNWTHRATSLVATSYPGYFGEYIRPAWVGSDPGNGWGVQHTDGGAPGRPFWSSLLRFGGLVISNGTELLGGTPFADVMRCDSHCGTDFTATSVALTYGSGADRVVDWTYETNGMTPDASFRIRQTSWDGSGGDFVLLRYLIRNTAATPTTINAGWFMDWEMTGTDDPDDDGATSREGRLMYTHAADGTGPYVGTLILRRSAAGNWFHEKSMAFIPVQQQHDAMSGADTQTTPGFGPGDLFYFHGAEAATLAPGEAMVLWGALVGGATLIDLEASADAAEAWADSVRATL